jgi:CelD/BcsL family acetyltransferase involved in cellulose biosynthesis
MIEVIDDPADLKAIANGWDTLVEPFHTPLLHHEWFSSCADVFYRPGQLRIIGNYVNGCLTAVAPLVLVKQHGSERLELLGESLLFEPTGFLYQDEAALHELLDAVAQIGTPLSLGRLRADAPEVHALQQAGRGKTFLTPAMGSPFIPINTTWDEFETGMSSDCRNEVRRKKKLLDKQGKLTFEIIPPHPDTMHLYLEDFMRVEAAGWKGKERTALLFDERRRNFFDRYGKAAARRGILRMCILRIDDTAIAAAIAVEDYNRFWLLKVGYDEEWRRFAPGILLLHETIRYAFDHGLESYEFLGDEAPWIRRWTKQSHAYVRARVYPDRFWGFRLALDASTSTFMKALTKIGG